MYFKMILLLSGLHCISAESSHKLCFAYGCFDSSETQVYATVDGDEVVHVDYQKGMGVWESKIPTTAQPAWDYKRMKDFQTLCKKDIHRWKPDTSVTKTKDPPDIVLFLRGEVIYNEENTLICFINNFFPPTIKIKWTKNDEEVKVEDSFLKTVSNPDGSFHVFSYLNFVPTDGDIYSCTVDHEALEKPKTRFWEIEIEVKGRGPAIFCGIAVTVGLLGVAGGTFFFVKGNQHHSILF